jgi:hypothetical protein
MTNSGAVAVANPRGADAPRSCVGVRMSAGEIAICAMHKRISAGAAGVSPPWFDTGRTCRTKRIMFGDHRLPHQERRASVHRASVAAPARAIGFPGVITFTTHDRMVPDGWLTPAAPGAALGGRTPIVANMRLRFARANRFTTTAGSRQPLLVDEAGPLKKATFAVHKRRFYESGDRQPAVVCKTNPAP